MDLWEYTKLALPVLATSFAVSAVVIEIFNVILYAVDRLRPRGRDNG